MWFFIIKLFKNVYVFDFGFFKLILIFSFFNTFLIIFLIFLIMLITTLYVKNLNDKIHVKDT